MFCQSQPLSLRSLPLLLPIVSYLATRHTLARVSYTLVHVGTRRPGHALGARGEDLISNYILNVVGDKGAVFWCGTRRECLCVEGRDEVRGRGFLTGLVLQVVIEYSIIIARGCWKHSRPWWSLGGRGVWRHGTVLDWKWSLCWQRYPLFRRREE